MFRIFSFLWICILSFTSLSHCKPADLENTCDARTQSYLLASIIRFATGDRSFSCLPGFTFLDQWGVYGDGINPAKVSAIEAYNGHILVGGDFTMVGASVGSVAMVDAQTGSVVANRFCPHLKVKGVSYIAISDGSGGFYIGGYLTYVQGKPRSQVAHILPGCELDPYFVPEVDPSRYITSMALLGENLYVGGTFTGWGTGMQSNIASINRYTAKLNTEFVTDIFDNSIYDIVTDGSSLYVGGHFQAIGASPKYGIAKLSPVTGAVDSTFTGQVPAGGSVNDLHLGNDATGTPVLYAVGTFSGVRTNATAFYLNGIQTAFAPNPNLTVETVYQYENTVYLGGEFTTINGGTAANYLVGVNNNTGILTNNDFVINNYVRTVNIIGNKMYVLGNFTEAKGQKRNYAAGYDLPSQSLNVWDPSFNEPIPNPGGAIVSAGSAVLIASNNFSINTKPRNHFVVFEEATGYPIDGTPNFNLPISALHVKDNHLFVGGRFENINGIPRTALAILDLPTYQLNPTNLSVSGSVPEIRTITSNNNQIFFGGFDMINVSGQTRNALAAIDSNSLTLTSWNPNLGVGGSASTLFVVDDLIFVGGTFSTMNGVGGVNNYRAVDTENGTMRSIPSATNYPSDGVYAQTYYDGKIYLGGIFTTIGSFGTFNYIASYDKGNQTYITPNTIYSDGNVSSLTASPEGKIVAAGSNSGLNGSTTNLYLSAFDAKTNTVIDWSPIPDNTANVSLYRNGKWYIGGDFIYAFNKPNGSLFISDLTEKN